jgi:hypothetical protein
MEKRALSRMFRSGIVFALAFSPVFMATSQVINPSRSSDGIAALIVAMVFVAFISAPICFVLGCCQFLAKYKISHEKNGIAFHFIVFGPAFGVVFSWGIAHFLFSDNAFANDVILYAKIGGGVCGVISYLSTDDYRGDFHI